MILGTLRFIPRINAKRQSNPTLPDAEHGTRISEVGGGHRLGRADRVLGAAVRGEERSPRRADPHDGRVGDAPAHLRPVGRRGCGEVARECVLAVFCGEEFFSVSAIRETKWNIQHELPICSSQMTRPAHHPGDPADEWSESLPPVIPRWEAGTEYRAMPTPFRARRSKGADPKPLYSPV